MRRDAASGLGPQRCGARYVRERLAPQVLTLRESVSVYGGFAGDEEALALLVLHDNHAFYGGGAFGADLVVEDSRFEDNTAIHGGAIHLDRVRLR